MTYGYEDGPVSDYVDTWIARVHPPAERLDGSICPVCRYKGITDLTMHYEPFTNWDCEEMGSDLCRVVIGPCGCSTHPLKWELVRTQFDGAPQMEWVRRKVMIR